MPQDLDGDEIGAPDLCTHHRAVLNNAKHLDHLDDGTASATVHSIATQCPTCTTRRTP